MLDIFRGLVRFRDAIRPGIGSWRHVLHERYPLAVRFGERSVCGLALFAGECGWSRGGGALPLSFRGLTAFWGVVFVIPTASEAVNPLYGAPDHGDNAVVEVHAAPSAPGLYVFSGTYMACDHDSSAGSLSMATRLPHTIEGSASGRAHAHCNRGRPNCQGPCRDMCWVITRDNLTIRCSWGREQTQEPAWSKLCQPVGEGFPNPNSQPPSDAGAAEVDASKPSAIQPILHGRQSRRSRLIKTPVPSETGVIFYPGGDLLSHAVTHAVPSALEGLTSVFGMGTGVAPPL